MQKYVRNVTLFGLLVLLVGCQSNYVSSPFNSSPGSVFTPMNSSLAQSVQDELARSGDPVIGQVIVQSEGRAVLLRGYVKKIRQSDTAEMIARKVPGVESVDNQIIVRQ